MFNSPTIKKLLENRTESFVMLESRRCTLMSGLDTFISVLVSLYRVLVALCRVLCFSGNSSWTISSQTPFPLVLDYLFSDCRFVHCRFVDHHFVDRRLVDHWFVDHSPIQEDTRERYNPQSRYNLRIGRIIFLFPNNSPNQEVTRKQGGFFPFLPLVTHVSRQKADVD